MAHTDIENATHHDCEGWYWWVPAAFAVGILIRLAGCVAINVSDRSKQGKKPLRTEMKTKSSVVTQGLLVLIAFIGLLALSSWLILKTSSIDQLEQI